MSTFDESFESAMRAVRRAESPTDPRPEFALDLRARIAAALTPTVPLPDRSATMTTTSSTSSTSSTPADDRRAGALPIVPYLAVRDAAAALDWYRDVFDAVETVRYVGDDGRVGHAELRIGGAALYLSDEYPDFDAVAPPTIGGTPVALGLEVADVDAVHRAAVAAGADSRRPPEDQAYGDRSCTFVDPFGHRWMVSTRIANPSNDEIEAAMDGYRIETREDRSDD